jgi:hypothetical protein
MHLAHELSVRGCNVPREKLTPARLKAWLAKPALDPKLLKQIDQVERETCAGFQGKACKHMARRGSALCEHCYNRQYQFEHGALRRKQRVAARHAARCLLVAVIPNVEVRVG